MGVAVALTLETARRLQAAAEAGRFDHLRKGRANRKSRRAAKKK
jgi:hypothetical protein